MDEWEKENVKEHKSREGVGAKDDYNIGTVVNYTSPHSKLTTLDLLARVILIVFVSYLVCWR